MEWRHPENGNEEHDRLNAAGLIKADRGIMAGGLHIYNKAALPALYDQRWMKRGMALWSTETGDMSAPKAAAQFLAGLLHGSAVEIAHLGIGSGKDQRQVLMNGERRRAPMGPADRADLARAAAGDRHARRHQQRPPRRHGRRPGAADAVDLDAAAAPALRGRRQEAGRQVGPRRGELRLRRRQPERVGRRPLRRGDPAADGADRRAGREERAASSRGAAARAGRSAASRGMTSWTATFGSRCRLARL